MKHIVICCDGTGNEYGDANSNVVKLYRALKKSPGQLVAYYHPGVGTMGAKNALTTAGKVWTKVRGLAFGYGLSENIADAYRYLMQTFEPDDRIYIFGFSRGAYTARALCGMLQMFGLLAPGSEGLIPYAMRLFKQRDSGLLSGLRPRTSKFQIASGFKSTFCRDCKPYFLGLWDTVSSVGWILDPIGLKPGGLPYTRAIGDVKVIRHALSIDERRAFFRQNLVAERPGGDMKQIWFAGVHSDVGGSYPEAESGLSKISLSWMIREAQSAQLSFEPAAVDRILGSDGSHAAPQPNAMMHNSMTPLWCIGEFWPKFTKRRVSEPGVSPEKFKGSPRLNLFHRRYIADGARIHQSVVTRMKLVPRYQPSNLPKPENFTIEPDLETTAYPTRLNVGDNKVAPIFARNKWNDTTIEVRTGETYTLEATGAWYDASIRTGPDGYASPSAGFRLVEGRRRFPEGNWFQLIGAIGQDGVTSFAVGRSKELSPLKDGVLYCYANDLPFMYGNNSGSLKLKVSRNS